MKKQITQVALLIVALGAVGTVGIKANIFKKWGQSIKKGFQEKIAKPFERDVIKPVEEKIIKPVEEKVIKPIEQAIRPLVGADPIRPNLPKIKVAGLDLNDTDRIVATFAPLLKFNSGEKYYPSSMEWLINRASLRKNREVLIPRGQLNVETLVNYINTKTKNDGRDLHLDLADGDAGYKEQTYRGMQPVGNKIKTPCYVNYRVLSANNAVIQLYFVYPFNEPTPLLQAGKFLVKTGAIGTVGSHEGDAENIDIYLSKKGNITTVEKIFFARHGAHSEFIDGTHVERLGTHPIVYVSKFGHASYASPILILNHLADTADGKGVLWECWKHFVILRPNSNPPSPMWARFKGELGTEKSVNPQSRGTGGSPRAPLGRYDWKGEGTEAPQPRTAAFR